eukprot:11989830-Ditylum_brightwellii.AAC.1
MEKDGKKLVVWFDDALEQIYGSWKVQKNGGYNPFTSMKKSLEAAPDKLTRGYSRLLLEDYVMLSED